MTEVLNIPGWSNAEAKKLESLRTKIQTTPDRRFAVAYAEATWIVPLPSSLQSPLIKYTYSKSARILTIIDLKQWKIAGNIRLSDFGTDSGQDTRIRIVNNSLLALSGGDRYDPRKDPAKWGRLFRLFTLPDLKPGPECATAVLRGARKGRENVAGLLDQQNDSACTEVLNASKERSVIILKKIF